MNNITSVKHPIRQHILEYLSQHEIARFRDLRPPRVDTNLFTYHLNSLVKLGFVVKTEQGYTLAGGGLQYADELNAESSMRLRPTIEMMFVVQNSDGDILLQRRNVQPYINRLALPYGEVLLGDGTIQEAAVREARKKFGTENLSVIHAGDCYIRVNDGKQQISVAFAHVFRFNSDDIVIKDSLMWARPHKLASLALAPATEDIAARTFFQDPLFFEEYSIQFFA
ncbi:NUDIX domain-containing protein [Candidatus Saccharibacteria bacterium]|nr:NUDIX domain-containing protein [Candidatus Saccharibacteria bacterium]NCS83040.1 NUDIX domain-containing protein [Candidatus Saccharibacteria bacterium]